MSTDLWTIQAAMEWTEGFLGRKGIENPRRQTQELTCFATGLSRLELYTHFDQPLTSEERAKLRDVVKRRADGEPLQYILGMAPFRFLEIEVARGVLIPRPETEGLVDIVLKYVADGGFSNVSPAQIAEIGTGSGCIACSLVSERDDTYVFACDISDDALAIAARNIENLAPQNRISIYEGTCSKAFTPEVIGILDVVISNPPYIPRTVLSELPEEVRDYEPALALDGGPDGLDVFRQIVAWATNALKPGGLLACELFEDSLDDAIVMTKNVGFAKAEAELDLTGRPRYLVAYR